MNDLDTKFKDEYQQMDSLPWILEESGRVVGDVRSAGAGNVTFVAVHEAGYVHFNTL